MFLLCLLCLCRAGIPLSGEYVFLVLSVQYYKNFDPYSVSTPIPSKAIGLLISIWTLGGERRVGEDREGV